MVKRKTFKARITTDAKKLWSCSNMLIGPSRDHKGKLPSSSGKDIELFTPGETPSTICNGTASWVVTVESRRKVGHGGFKVCNHQVDLVEELNAEEKKNQARR
jgi:hypothetical protein